MNNSINIMKLLFYGYLGLILYLYVKEVPDLNTPESLTDKHMHFIVFFILGSIAQVINGKDNNFSFGVSLALIVSLFIETLHYFLPYRDFEIFDGVFNILGCVSAIFIVYLYRKNTQ